MNFYIVALFRFKEGYIAEAEILLEGLVLKTREEKGCLQYDLIRDNYNTGSFFLIELWESQEHHNKHRDTDHLITFKKEVQAMLDSSIEVYKGFKIF